MSSGATMVRFPLLVGIAGALFWLRNKKSPKGVGGGGDNTNKNHQAAAEKKKAKNAAAAAKKKNKKKEKKKADKQQAIANGNNTDSHGKEKGKKVTSTGASNMAARVAGGRRVMKKANTKKHKDGGIASKVQRTENKKDVKKKLKDKLHKKTGGLNPKHANKQQLVPGVMQQSTKGKQDSIGTKEGGDGDGGQETYSMGYSYTTTVTDARVQAISGKHKALLAKAIPGTTKK